MFKRIKSHVGELTLSEICEFARVIRESKIPFTEFYEIAEPFIVNQMSNLNDADLMNAFVAFNNETNE